MLLDEAAALKKEVKLARAAELEAKVGKKPGDASVEKKDE